MVNFRVAISGDRESDAEDVLRGVYLQIIIEAMERSLDPKMSHYGGWLATSRISPLSLSGRD